PAGAAAARCGGADTPLAALALAETPPAGEIEVEAVVSARFLGQARLNGFYVAEPGPGGEPVGLFVYAPDIGEDMAGRLEPGSRVRMRGRLGRYQGQRQLERISGISVCGTVTAPEPVGLELPADRARLHRLEGLPVRIEQTLTVTDNYDLGRYGSVALVPGPRLFARPAQGTRPFRLVLDDGSHEVRPDPVPYLDESGTRRLGSRLEQLTGVLAGTFGAYRVHPLRAPRWVEANPRRVPQAPEDGAIRLALFNVRNYMAAPGGRGARSGAEQRLQRAKLVAAIEGVDADVLALLEVGNTARAVTSLRDAVNARLATGRGYRTVLPPGPVGSDAIRAVLLYRPAALSLAGEGGVLKDRRFERPPVWARFHGEGAPAFTVISAHLKSKGGCPDGAEAADSLAGCWSERRAMQGRGLRELTDALPGDRELLLADLNAYDWEAPVALLRRAGLRDLVAAELPASQRYTYVYRGRAGTLDYALAGRGLEGRVAGVRIWHLNADEPRFLGYRSRRDQAARRAGEYRSSDHDVIIVDLTER
ncbi:ExeM/NucH family extracellular endonuclease, partial [Ectothiorhodospiraceae bacterium WFHF3C12]|nr:ExeM/NucH family extracellular endonuclease [Ectothiorhodospiraceae bacterium WFHF3C12]